MLSGRDILIFAGDWGWFPSVMERIAEQLLGKNRIIWVGSVSMRRPRIGMYDLRRITKRLRAVFTRQGGEHNDQEHLYQVHPFVLPFYDVAGIKKLNDAMLRRVLRARIKELNFNDVILLSATPMVVDVVGTLGESSSHYFCLDDYSEYDGSYGCIPELERKLLGKVNSCFALSEPLLQTRKATSGENHFLPMGVDTDHFRRSEETLIPPELQSLRKPIAGFFGQIGSYVDIDLLVRSAKAYPDVSFVVIGRALVDVSAFAGIENISFLGEIPYERMPQYASAFDVGLNPRVINKLSIAMNPLKILEYLALGMPVVSTDLPAVRTFKEYVHIAESSDHFVKLIGIALQEKSQQIRIARRTVAEQYSWKSIAARVSDVIDRIDTVQSQSHIVTIE